MRGKTRQKPASQLQNPRGGRGAKVLAVVDVPGEALEIPPLPEGVTGAAVGFWEAFWRCPQARVVQTATDLERIQRWAYCISERDRLEVILKGDMFPVGTGGSMILHPVNQRIRDLTTEIRNLSEQFGFTPMSRFRLGLTFAQGKTAADKAGLGRPLGGREEPEEWSPEGGV